MCADFELLNGDVAARIGELPIPRCDVTIETPTLLPVVNPHVQAIPPATLAEFGADILITNAYILYQSTDLRDAVLTNGVHDVLGFDGPIMTDSGSFQLAGYGEIDVTTAEILEFQRAIGTDIATPVDIPTPPDADKARAQADIETTQDRLATAAAFDAENMLITAPIQGSTYPDLREHAARDAYGTGLDVFPIGGLVPLLNDYRFDDLVTAVAAAKRGLGVDAPVHMFGAGHPMMFALAVALGCDLFDSAAYAIYARDDRYMTVNGTEHLDDLAHLPCTCEVCAAHDAVELKSLSDDPRHRLLAEHNLRVSFGELRRIKQAIRAGRLLRLVEARARAHPALLDGYRALLDHADALEQHDPVRKAPFFYVSPESARRPEIHRYHDRLTRLEPPTPLYLIHGPAPEVDATTWRVIPPFGPAPPALTSTPPLTAELPTDPDAAALHAAATGITRLAETSPEAKITFLHDDWPDAVLDRLPATVTVESTRNSPAGPDTG